MNPLLRGLSPHLLWKHFDRLSRIPRCSGNEEAAMRYVREVAESLGLDFAADKVGNLVVRKHATAGLASAPVVAVQAHVDMVCEKNRDYLFDFAKDSIQLRLDGEYLATEGTTLGADNGIGAAAALALLEDQEAVHGPLELLFTVDEETGLTGAYELQADMLSARVMINLDTEEENAIYIGCSGGGQMDIHLPLERKAAEGQTLKIFLSGLKGGHSGVEIHLERGNAIKLLGRLLYHVGKKHHFRLVSFTGGDKHNAIPREAEAVITLPKGAGSFREDLMRDFQAIQEEYRTKEPGMILAVENTGVTDTTLADSSTTRLLRLVTALPHGIQRWSPDLADLVETSCNVAKIRTGDKAHILVSVRSSIISQLEAVRDAIEATAAMAGATSERDAPYPGWRPNPESRILRIFKEAGREIWGRDPDLKAIHAGLETGVIGEKIPGMDMISIGPRIECAHSPDERVHIGSVDAFYRFLKKGLEKAASLNERNE